MRGLYKTKRTHAFNLCLCIAVSMTFFLGVLLFSTEAAAGVSGGLNFCLSVLIPSLFPFVALSLFIVESGLSSSISKVTGWLTKLLFNLPGSAGATLLLGLLGGYPVGARGVRSLLEKGDITKAQAKRMMCFAVCAGPAFLIGFIGERVYQSRSIGVIILLSQLIPAVLIGVISGLFFKREKTVNIFKYKKNSLGGAVVISCNGAARAMLSMCALIIVFSAFLAIFDAFGVLKALTTLMCRLGVSENSAKTLFPLCLEITGGSALVLKYPVSPVLLSFAVAFGGVCVHFQIFAILGDIGMSKGLFVAFRALHGILAAAFTHIAMLMYSPATEVISTVHSQVGSAVSGSITGGAALLFMSACFLLSVKKSKIQEKSIKYKNRTAQ